MGGAAVSSRILRVSYPSEPTAVDGECICNTVHLSPPFRCLETYLAGHPIAHSWRGGETARLHVFPDTIGKLRFVFAPRNDLQYFWGYLGPPVVDCSRNNYWCAETCYYSLSLSHLSGRFVGTACTTQGLSRPLQRSRKQKLTQASAAVLTQIGTWSSGYFTVIIAIHTFMSLVLKRGQSLLLSRCAMSFGWILAGVIGASE
jgi:hypothetical protein